jgi:hypothetical protein
MVTGGRFAVSLIFTGRTEDDMFSNEVGQANAIRVFNGGIGKIREGLITAVFDDDRFYMLAGIIGSVLLADAIMRRYKKPNVHVPPIGTTFLQKEGIQ